MRRHGVRADDGATLAVQTHGSDEAPVSIVFAHGWTLGAEIWDDVIFHLLEALGDDVNIVSYDCRGHGRSDPGQPGRASLEQLADDLRVVIDDCAPVGEVILVGHSLGGMTLLTFAKRHRDLLSERVAGAAFVCSSPGRMWNPLKRMFGFYALAPLVLKLSSPRMLRPSRLTRMGLRHGLYGGTAQTRHLNETIRQMRAVDPVVYAELGVSMMRHECDPILRFFDGIPTVVFAGTRDRLTPARHGRRIAEGIDAATLFIEPGAGHMIPCERPNSLARELVAMTTAATEISSADRVVERTA